MNDNDQHRHDDNDSGTIAKNCAIIQILPLQGANGNIRLLSTKLKGCLFQSDKRNEKSSRRTLDISCYAEYLIFISLRFMENKKATNIYVMKTFVVTFHSIDSSKLYFHHHYFIIYIWYYKPSSIYMSFKLISASPMFIVTYMFKSTKKKTKKSNQINSIQ